MGERTHTPGPWTVKRSPGLHDGAHDYAISADGATVLSEAFGRGALGEWLPADANARLIAAAPDMFEALLAAARADKALDEREGYGEWEKLDQLARDLRAAALAKAEGRTNLADATPDPLSEGRERS